MLLNPEYGFIGPSHAINAQALFESNRWSRTLHEEFAQNMSKKTRCWRPKKSCIGLAFAKALEGDLPKIYCIIGKSSKEYYIYIYIYSIYIYTHIHTKILSQNSQKNVYRLPFPLFTIDFSWLSILVPPAPARRGVQPYRHGTQRAPHWRDAAPSGSARPQGCLKNSRGNRYIAGLWFINRRHETWPNCHVHCGAINQLQMGYCNLSIWIPGGYAKVHAQNCVPHSKNLKTSPSHLQANSLRFASGAQKGSECIPQNHFPKSAWFQFDFQNWKNIRVISSPSSTPSLDPGDLRGSRASSSWWSRHDSCDRDGPGPYHFRGNVGREDPCWRFPSWEARKPRKCFFGDPFQL